MENNQHSSGQNATTESAAANSFSNQQPGQQLPANATGKNDGNTQPLSKEQHSESSKPEGENETLGTP